MNRTGYRPALLAVLLLGMPGAAYASDDAFELWFNPSVDVALDRDNTIELETAQRFRSASDGRSDTYFARLWLHHKIADNATLSGAFEQRENDGGLDEVRTMQQLATSHGYLRTRLRLEQRWVEDQSRMGLRLRPRLGVKVPLDGAEKLAFKADTELFITLRSSRVGPADDSGLTGVRSQLGLSYAASDKLELSLTYLRQQNIRDNAPDRVGHAPLIGIAYSS